jgi:hypothetical protein
MTDDFLRDPVAAYLDGSIAGVPDEWFQAAWYGEEGAPARSLRDWVTQDVWHEVNKGALGLIAGQLRGLGQLLTHDQWDDLYRDLRYLGPHREPEVRREFIAAAPDKVGCLPPPLTYEEVVSLLGSPESARLFGVFKGEAPGEHGVGKGPS